MKGLYRSAIAALAAIGLVSAAAAQDMMDIKVGAATATDHVPAFAALERGIFAKHGLNAQIIMYPTGVEMINGLMSGAQQVNIMGTIPFLAGVSNGLPLVLIGHQHADATQDNYSTGHSIIAGPDTGIESVADLAGKRIGLPRGTGAEGYLLGMLQAAGVAEDDVTLVNVKPADTPTALAQGDVDAIVGWEPWPSTAVVKAEGATRIAAGGCPTCYIPAAVLTTRSIIEENPELLRRFSAALSESQQWVRNNFEEAAEINMRWVPGVEIEIMKEAVRQASYDGRISAYLREELMNKTIPSLVAAGNLRSEFDPGEAIDAQFILNTMGEHPEFFSDLPPIPEDKRLSLN